MTSLELLARLRRLDVDLWVEGEELCFSASPGVMTPALRGELAAAKAEVMELLRSAAAARTSPAVAPVPREGDLPLSFAQERLWFLSQLSPGSARYNVYTALAWCGQVDLPALAAGLGDLVGRHEALRTRFADRGGRPVQVPAAPAPGRFPVPVVELSHLPPEDRLPAAKALAAREAARPFRLDRGPLLRVRALRLAPGEGVLVLTLHHIVCDDWSLEVLVREVAALYGARLRGEPAPLPPLPVQYADFAVWQRRALEGAAAAPLVDYWRRRLAGASAASGLPTDRPRPLLDGHRGGIVRRTLPAGLAAAVEALGRRAGTTLFMTLLAGFYALLHRLGGRRDLVVGSPIANRTRSEVEGLIGFFVNTLALRADLRGEPSLGRLLEQVRRRVLEAYEHQDLPFERVVEAVAPARRQGESPLFEVMLVLQSFSDEAIALPGAELAPLPVDNATSLFDFTLSLIETPAGLAAVAEYDADLFDRSTVQRLLGHYERLLAAGAARLDDPIARLPLLAPAERWQLVGEWNDRPGPAIPEAGSGGVHALWRTSVRRAPQAVAVVWRDEQLSYREVDRRAGRLGASLGRLGVGPEVRVGLLLERSADLAVAVLGVLAAGGAYVPLDAASPRERLAFLLADAGMALLLTQRRLAGSTPPFAGPVLTLEAALEAGGGEPPPPPESSPDHLAYVLYTSGSTGRPKGVMVRHRALLQAFAGWREAYRLAPGDRHLQMASFSFDVFSGDLVRCLGSGGRLVLCPTELLPAPEELDRHLRREVVHLGEFVPAVARPLIEHWARAGGPPASLRLLVVGSEAWSAGEFRRLAGLAAAGTRLVSSYGVTEATIDSSYFEGDLSRSPADATVPIGRPFPSARLYALAAGGEPVPTGAFGELAIGGPGLARGYLGRPGLTADRFVPDPLGGEPGERLYRTGDRARCLAGGVIEFAGRVDHQVKVRGFRVEPGEIEAVLGEHPEVAQAAVTAWREEGGEASLAAYLVGRGGAVPDARGLRRFLTGRLPAYMVPAAFVTLERLPLTVSGKVDRRALPAPGRSRAAAEEGYEAPATPTEEIVAAIWAEVLEVEPVGVLDGFFALGGHSLLATRVVARVREALGVELPVRSLLDGPTVRDLAARVDELRGGGREAAPPPLEPVPRTGLLPLSFAQERLWFLARLDPASAAYVLPAAARLTGRLRPRALAGCLEEIVRRHEVLRTVLPAVGGLPRQRVLPPGRLALPAVDLSALPGPVRHRLGLRLAEKGAERPFRLEEEPPRRACLVRLGDDEHLLLLDLHHAAADGWSLAVLEQELAVLYPAAAAGDPPPLPPLPVQYGDYAAWQRSWLTEERLAPHLDDWRRRLAGLPAALELPTDRPRPARRTFTGGRWPVRLEADLVAALTALGRGHAATLFMTLLAAFGGLLSRFSGQGTVAVGTPEANRDHPGLEGLIGFFVNTLVMRVDAGDDPRFSELLSRVREVALAAYDHRELPFERLVSELNPARDLSRSPLFGALLALQTTPPGPGLSLPGLSAEPLVLAAGAAKFDLTLDLAPAGGALAGWLDYDRELFDETTVARMGRHLLRLLEAAAADPDRPLSRLPLLGPVERQQLGEWNDTAAPEPGLTLHELVLAAAGAASEAVAVVAGDEHLGRGHLAAAAGRLARRLRQLGVGPDQVVGISADLGPELVAGMLGILSAGAAVLALEPDLPALRREAMAADAGVRVLLRQEHLAPWPAEGSGTEASRQVLLLGRASSPGGGESAPAPTPAVPPVDALAYVVFTSGSTGRPKGVMNTHRGIVNLLVWARRALPLGPADRVLARTPASFDVSVLELFRPLAAGAALVMAPPGRHRDPAVLAALTEERRVTELWSVPSLLPAFLEAAGAGARAALRRVCATGEALPAAVAERFPRHREPALYNLYGPAEAAVEVSWWPCRAPRRRAEPPIGRPVAGTALHLLDPRGRPVPAGVAGEIHAGGVQLARGYLGRPALTAERFVPAPGGERLYRTGDLGRRSPGGEVEYLGRLDHQVKLRGVRIEPGEIEAALSAHPAVAAAAVAPRPGPSGEAVLVAYLVPAAGAPVPGARELRACLGRSLPAAMVPAVFSILEELPRTVTGKVDRRALPAPAAAGAARAAGRTPPRTPAEEMVAEVWGQVLGVAGLAAEDDFFALGGHSLRAVQVVSRLERLCGRPLPLRAAFEEPTLAGLARRVETALQAAAAAPPPPVTAVERGGELPLSYAQERMWFLAQLQPGGVAYNLPAAVAVEGRLRVRPLERTLAEIVRRHEALRTTFELAGRRPGQVIHPPAPPALPSLPVVDLSGLPPRQRAPLARRLAVVEAERPFDLARGPLLRAALVRRSAREHLVLLDLHHAAADQWSLAVLLREVGVLYGAFAADRPSPLPPLAVQYADYAAWQRRWLESGVMAEQLAWWKERLSPLPPALELPSDRPRPARRSGRGRRLPVAWPDARTGALAALARRSKTTLFTTLLAAFAALLARYTGQGTVVVGTPVANRRQPETEELIGFFVNDLALRLELAGSSSFARLLEQAREVTLGAWAHQDLPFEKLVEELQPERTLDRTPLFQVVLALNNAPLAAPELPGLRWELLASGDGTAKFDLTLELSTVGDGLVGAFEYSTDLFDGTTIARLSRHLQALADGAAGEPGRPVGELPLLAPGEGHQVVHEWRSWGSAPGDRPGCLHQRFGAHAAATPQRVAVVDGEELLSYGELARRAGRVARALGRRGVGPESRVALCVDRSADVAVGVLGVLQAGAAYVPLDPAYPEARLAFLLADAFAGAPPVAVTRRRLARLPGTTAAGTVLLDGAEAGAGAATAPAPDLTPDHLAYVIYTSGSTGEPKGALVTHRNVTRLLDAAEPRVGFGREDVWTLFHSFAFDFSVWELWGALACGGRLVVVPWLASRSPRDFAGLLERQRVTVLNQTPSAFRQLAAQLVAEEEAGEPRRRFALRLVIFGGEALEPASLAAWTRRRGAQQPRLVNLYGITETTVHVTWRTLSAADLVPGRGSLIGRPLPHLRLALLDRHGRPVPAGVPGEIHVGGDGVGRGYHRRGGLTARRFVPDPQPARPGDRLYRAGDLARHRGDGELEFLGRIDHQVKLRGFRIEPGEIESLLEGHPGVRQAAVVLRRAEGGGAGSERLVAYVVAAGEGPPGGEELRAYLSERLPGHMVPAACVLLDGLPLTPHGKLDRRALPAPDGARPDLDRVYRPPRDELEELLAEAWSEALAVERVGLDDDFFELGGHSLLAVEMIAWVRETFGVEVHLETLFLSPTVAGLAAALRVDPEVRGRVEEVASMLLDLGRLSDDEIKAEVGVPAASLPGEEAR